MNRCVRLGKFLAKRPGREKSTSSTGRAAAVRGLTRLNLNERQLPKQPVPDLEKTADRYLRSVRALLSDEQYLETEKIMMEFTKERGIGRTLQESLLRRHDNTDSWMNEWFLHSAYLDNRDPLIVASSPGTVGPPQTFQSVDDFCTFAARLVEAMGTYNDAVKSGKLRQETIREDPLDMQPYAMILGTHRRPGEKSDKLLHTDDSRHIIVMSNNHLFKLYMYDDNENLLSESQLRGAIKDAYERSRIAAGKPVGILTGNDRDRWARDHDRLKAIGKNAEVLADIEGALFLLCLDESLPETAFADKNIASVRAVQSMTGYGSSTNSGNRWHDKTVQYIVSPDGFVGMEYEHSPCEGVPVAALHDHVLTSIEKRRDGSGRTSCDFRRALRLEFELDEGLERAIEDATHLVDKISTDIDMECLNFDDFGKSAIKEARQSPDSFIQVAMQVALYKSQGKAAAHYESAALRRFRNTRTECIRSTSTETVDFAKIMASSRNEATKKRREAMSRAIEAHKRIAAEAGIGQGVDRHLFGLKMIAKSGNLEIPALYRDIGFTKSTHFTLTSSQVPYKTASFMCYGPVVADGYGCCYNPRSEDILLACSSYKSCEETSSMRFAETLGDSLRDMMRLAKG